MKNFWNNIKRYTKIKILDTDFTSNTNYNMYQIISLVPILDSDILYSDVLVI